MVALFSFQTSFGEAGVYNLQSYFYFHFKTYYLKHSKGSPDSIIDGECTLQSDHGMGQNILRVMKVLV